MLTQQQLDECDASAERAAGITTTLETARYWCDALTAENLPKEVQIRMLEYVASRLSSPALARDMRATVEQASTHGTTTSWVLERGASPVYAGLCSGRFTHVFNIDCAMRFARQRDAERFQELLHTMDVPGANGSWEVVEHMWCDPSQCDMAVGPDTSAPIPEKAGDHQLDTLCLDGPMDISRCNPEAVKQVFESTPNPDTRIADLWSEEETSHKWPYGVVKAASWEKFGPYLKHSCSPDNALCQSASMSIVKCLLFLGQAVCRSLDVPVDASSGTDTTICVRWDVADFQLKGTQEVLKHLNNVLKDVQDLHLVQSIRPYHQAWQIGFDIVGLSVKE